MIAKVLRGWRPGGLIAYLFGPGKHEEHRNPRVVAAWDGAPWLHQPDRLPGVVLDGEVLPAGEFDLDLRALIRTLQDMPQRAGLPSNTPPPITPELAQLLIHGGPLPRTAPPWLRHYRFDPQRNAVVTRPGYVWHCPVRLHPDDPVLTDAQWERIALRLMQATGIHQAGCRWVAVRHADDHIHLVATLVSEHTGKRFHPYRDYPKLRAACQQLERELGLTPTAGADRTAPVAPTRAEKAKAQRLGQEQTAREQLRRRVALCAATTTDARQFLTKLAQWGLDPRTTQDATGEIVGYTVAWPGDHTATGRPVRYSGTALASDLTWPTLAARWASIPPQPGPPARTGQGRVAPAERRAALTHATSTAHHATTLIRTSIGGGEVDGIAHAAGEVLTAFSHGRDGPHAGTLSTVADRYDRAARVPQRVLPVEWGPVTQELRLAARRLAAVGALTGRGQEKFATTALVLALASLVAEIAAWHQHHHRPHQAAAARAAGHTLATLADPTEYHAAPASLRTGLQQERAARTWQPHNPPRPGPPSHRRS